MAWLTKSGHLREYAGRHPYANGRRLMYVHVKVMELHIGRALQSNEHVHHIDEDKLNNALENLALMTVSEHARVHALTRRHKRDGNGRFV